MNEELAAKWGRDVEADIDAVKASIEAMAEPQLAYGVGEWRGWTEWLAIGIFPTQVEAEAACTLDRHYIVPLVRQPPTDDGRSVYDIKGHSGCNEAYFPARQT